MINARAVVSGVACISSIRCAVCSIRATGTILESGIVADGIVANVKEIRAGFSLESYELEFVPILKFSLAKRSAMTSSVLLVLVLVVMVI